MTISQENLHALSTFACVAAEFCDFIDSMRDGRPAGLYRKLEEILPRLHAGILPVHSEMGERKHPEFDKLGMTHEQWCEVAKTINGVVGKETYALFMHHGGAKPEADYIEKYCASRAEMLWDDLADIYRELHRALTLWKLGDPDAQAEAAWNWRYNYEIHWGNHLFRAMTTVHEARYLLYED